ncbi:VOC family protein [Streptomyces azureus]|uniref:VOC family protein n=1 Tax=Streptomyces azureus TaxID=146537 RepID=UPI00099C4541|nr:VOC family protein [Streptomyces azureus]
MPEEPAVRELRLVVTADDYDAALHFYRDVLGLTEQGAFASESGRDHDPGGRAGHPGADRPEPCRLHRRGRGGAAGGRARRVAFQVDDSVATTAKLAAAGAEVVAGPTRTPWNSVNYPSLKRRAHNGRHWL